MCGPRSNPPPGRSGSRGPSCGGVSWSGVWSAIDGAPAGLLLGNPRLRVVLVLEAAHQPAAHPGDLRRVEREPLGFRHLDRDRIEALEVRRAAELLAARPASAAHLSVLAIADLLQLDPHVELRGQVADEVAEIDARLRGEEEGQAPPREVALDVAELHRERPLLDARQAVRARVLLPGELTRVALLGLARRASHDAGQAGPLGVEGVREDRRRDRSELDAVLGVDETRVPDLERKPRGVTGTGLGEGPQADADHVHAAGTIRG